ncbi:MAG TPA: siderophore-interacting protein [Bosea sp. (in: a-proteobacteria)]|jgi:NADPH-dependent ferric siderophore reductase|uniref:siderophore-interacting protein n=1 Tax=Bosea sp. (in: a-proteobacteria) TaxID=1871050 RepID=UPI002E0F0CC1|nr:siderophore-interacting protein [Bosea sp. (in: a-proteobacteria)]
MSSLSAETTIALAQPDAVLGPLCDHLLEHDAQIRREPGETVILLGGGQARLRAGEGLLAVAIEAPDLAALQNLKRAIASHVVEFAPAGDKPVIGWSGDGQVASLPPEFRVLTVTSTEQLSPHMKRIHLRGDDIARYASLEALHVRLFLPPPDLAEPVWPMLGSDGLLQLPSPEQRPAVRKYTIRQIDVAAGTLAIDFVLHDDAGPGSAFAARARAGDLVGMAGPGGRGLKTAERYVFLCDETGLPAVGRMLENLPTSAQGLALIEVANAGEEQPLAAPAGISIRWLHREALPAGQASGLAEAFDALTWDADGPETYLWSATENEAFRHIRSAARQRLRTGLDQHLVVSYWRAGLSEDQHAAEKKAAARAA